MNKTALTAATSLLLLAACDDGDHAHGHDHAEKHAETTPATPAPTPAPAPAAASAPVEATVGELVVRLQPGADTLRLGSTQRHGSSHCAGFSFCFPNLNVRRNSANPSRGC